MRFCQDRLIDLAIINQLANSLRLSLINGQRGHSFPSRAVITFTHRLKAFKLTAIAPWVIMEKDANGKQIGKTSDVASEIKLPIAEYLSLSSFENRIGKAIKNGALANRFDDGLDKILKSVDEIVLEASKTKKG